MWKWRKEGKNLELPTCIYSKSCFSLQIYVSCQKSVSLQIVLVVIYGIYNEIIFGASGMVHILNVHNVHLAFEVSKHDHSISFIQTDHRPWPGNKAPGLSLALWHPLSQSLWEPDTFFSLMHLCMNFQLSAQLIDSHSVWLSLQLPNIQTEPKTLREIWTKSLVSGVCLWKIQSCQMSAYCPVSSSCPVRFRLLASGHLPCFTQEDSIDPVWLFWK